MNLIPHDPYVLYYIYALLVAFPMTRIFARMNLPRAWTALLAVPMAGLACCAAVMVFKGRTRKEKP